ncbi:class I SAM-dependent methyltransferase [Actinopolymorpha pittospori]
MPDRFPAAAVPDLPLTGERTMPGIWHETYWFARHLVVYRWVADRLAGPRGAPEQTGSTGRVLDAGCGEGYGANLLASSTPSAVVGLDYDAATAQHARRAYPDVSVVRGNLVTLPFADDSFDGLVSLQTVEHLWDQEAFVAECARVTAPGGMVVMSTPNRLTFPPGNICHARELTAAEFRSLLDRPGLADVALVGLRHGARIEEFERRHGDVVKAQLAASPQAWSPDLAEFVASLGPGDFEVGEGDLDSSLDLIAVARTDTSRTP